MTSRQRLHLVPVGRIQLLLELSHLRVVSPIEARLARVLGGDQQLLEAAAQSRSVRQLDVEFDAIVFAAHRHQLIAVPISQALQLSTPHPNTNTQDDIYSAFYTAPAICESSLWIMWTKVGRRQVAANSSNLTFESACRLL